MRGERSRQQGEARREWIRQGDVTWHQLREIYLRDGGACVYCGDAVKTSFNESWPAGFDHVIPFVKGGRHTAENLVTCCRRCNARKNDTFLEEAGAEPHHR